MCINSVCMDSHVYYMNTEIYGYIHKRADKHKFTQNKRTHTNAHLLSHRHRHRHTYTHSCSLASTHTHTHTLTRAHTHTYTPIHTDTDTDTHASLSCFRSRARSLNYIAPLVSHLRCCWRY